MINISDGGNIILSHIIIFFFSFVYTENIWKGWIKHQFIIQFRFLLPYVLSWSLIYRYFGVKEYKINEREYLGAKLYAFLFIKCIVS